MREQNQGRPTEGELEGMRREAADRPARPEPGSAPGYHGRSFLKPPVWTWEVPVYLFVGGLAGMAGVIALGTLRSMFYVDLTRACLWTALAGCALSAVLLVRDLGRPARFLNMLRVFKWRSPMSVGVWLLSSFGAFTAMSLLLIESGLYQPQSPLDPVEALLVVSMTAAGVLGALVATYTGVLLGATVVPAWSVHARLLPVHFGLAGLGSAAAFFLLLGFEGWGLERVAILAAGGETLLAVWIEARRHGDADRALREGRSGAMLRLSAVLVGPVALLLWLAGATPWGSAAFLIGAVLGRFGWVAAGRASALDPRAAFALHGAGAS